MIKCIVQYNTLVVIDESLELFQRLLNSYNGTGKILTMEISEYSPNTTENQMSLFKALLVKSSEISGYTYQEFEEELINNFAPYKYTKSILGEMVKTRKSVSEMNNREFNVFIEQSIQFCKEFYEIEF